VPTRRDRRREVSRGQLRRRLPRVALGVLLAVVVVALVWKVGRLGSSDEAASASSGISATASPSPVPSYAEGSTAGAIAPDFPSSVVPVLQGATVVSSSTEPVGDGSHVRVSLGLRTAEPAKKIVADYAHTWTSQGFDRTHEKPVAGADAGATFRRAAPTPKANGTVGTVELTDYLVIAVVDADGSRLVTISGQIATPKA
jgi:hypothetical protein